MARRSPLPSVLKAARAHGWSRVKTPDGYVIDLSTETNEDTGDDIDRLLEQHHQHQRKTTNHAQKKT